MATLATVDPTAVARPLKVLAPLIQQDIEDGEKAGMEYYRHAGEKLNEALGRHFEHDRPGFYRWAQKNFNKSRGQLQLYMALAEHPEGKFKSQRDYQRRTGKKPTPNRIHRDWARPVDDIAAKAREEMRRIQVKEALDYQLEREAEAKLGVKLIDIGFRVLAQELHPDKGGTRQAMSRLNKVRERLKASV